MDGGSSDDASGDSATPDDAMVPVPDASPEGGLTACTYTNDTQFCACLGNYTCGAVVTKDSTGTVQPTYCGGCSKLQYCQPGPGGIALGLGTCATNPYLKYPWQRQKIDMLVSMGENDNTVVNYSSCTNKLMDGRGYTIGQVGFTTGTGDFALVAKCFNDLKPNNVLSKYWKALLDLEIKYVTTGMNQNDMTGIDAVGNFCKDIATAAAEPDHIFTGCQDDVGDGLNMSSAITHALDRHFQGVLTVGFLYDTELNFGEGDDPGGLGGTATVIKRADADYGPNLPTDFTGKAWEESRWLGFLIRERVVEMSGDPTWRQDLDQNATWEAARRLHTGAAGSPEGMTDLGMTYDITSAYKAGAGANPCWKTPPLLSKMDTMSTIYVVGLNQSAGATNQAMWTATSTMGPKYLPCPANPTP
jgi:hypothetical protein